MFACYLKYQKVYKCLVPKENMAKLQKQVSRKVGDKKYSKYVVVIPEEIVEEANLKEGDELKFADVKKGKISIIKF